MAEPNEVPPLSRDVLDLIEAEPPPNGFADRVASMAKSEVREHISLGASKVAKRSFAALTVGLAAAVVISFIAIEEGETFVGDAAPTERTTISLGTRGRVVAEVGSVLRYRVEENGRARVVQSRGSAFYRIDHGEEFVVETPAGEVTVHGTCFRVEVSEMGSREFPRSAVKGAVIGAAIAAAVTVSVYEGKVVLANDHGSAEIEAGQVSRATLGEAPSVAHEGGQLAAAGASIPAAPDPAILDQTPSSAATRDDLAQQNEALRTYAREERARAQALADEVTRLRAAGPQRPEGARHASDENFFEPSAERLQELVDNCGTMVDMPPVMSTEPGTVSAGERDVVELGLRDAELPVVNDAIQRIHGNLRSVLTAAYIEATGDTQGAAALSPNAMLEEIEDKGLEGEGAHIRRQLALERAGQAQAPSDTSTMTPLERAMRAMNGTGDDMQRTLAETLGPERARELRAARGGWPWSRSRSMGCAD